jgi:phosphatidylglycerophosphate synthase
VFFGRAIQSGRGLQLPVSAFYAIKSGAVFLAIMLIVARRRRAYHPFPRFGPANQVTTVRALLTALVAGLVGEPHVPAIAAAAVVMSTLATLLDFFDGWFARRTQMISAFGARFDMEIDALLIQVLAILAWRHGKAGVWVLFSGLLRYIFVAAGWMWPWLQRTLFPSFRRKAVCVAQIVGLVIAMMPTVRPPLSSVIAACSLAALSYSFAADTVWLWRRRSLLQ